MAMDFYRVKKLFRRYGNSMGVGRIQERSEQSASVAMASTPAVPPTSLHGNAATTVISTSTRGS
jgi:hypothetical protein